MHYQPQDGTTAKTTKPGSGSGSEHDAAIAKLLRTYEEPYTKLPTSVGVLVVVGFIAGGAVLFSVWEDWNLFDGAYFCFVTLTTIGFGDLVPGKSLMHRSTEKLALCSVYLLLGMALIAMCFKLMQDDIVQLTVKVGHKVGLLFWESESETDETEDY